MELLVKNTKLLPNPVVANFATTQSESMFSKCNSTRIAFVEWHIPLKSSSSRMRGSRNTDSSQRSITLVEPERFIKPCTPSGNHYAWIPAFARKTCVGNVFHYELDTSGLSEMDCRVASLLAMTEGVKHPQHVIASEARQSISPTYLTRH